MAMTENLKRFAQATNDDLIDSSTGEWYVKREYTQDTLEQFEEAHKSWVEATKPQRGEIDGLPFVAYAKAQARKGDQRGPVSMIDLGHARMIVREDLTDYE